MGKWIGKVHVHDTPEIVDVVKHGGEVWECACGVKFLLNVDGYWTQEDPKKPFTILSEGE